MHQLASYLQSGYTKDQLCTMLNTLESADYLHPAVYHDASALKLILTILTGDKYAIMKHARDRPHAFILYYRYNQEYTDTINSEDVFKAAKEFYSQMPIEEPDIIQHLLMGDIYNVLNICTEGDWWFLAHLADLLALRKLVPETMTAKLNDLSISIPTGEYFMLYFASYLVNRFGMWKEGFDYLLLCGEYGKEVVIEVKCFGEKKKDTFTQSTLLAFKKHPFEQKRRRAGPNSNILYKKWVRKRTWIRCL